MTSLRKFAVAAAAPFKRLDIRSSAVERALQLPLTDEDVRLIRGAGTGVRLGAYYHWYLQKLIIANAIKGLKREKALAFIRSVDHTDYSQVQELVDSPTGAIVAIPHHAHYILSMTALAHRIGKHRNVKVFYGDPATHKGNAVFDHLHEVLFAGTSSGVEVIHDNRQGLAKAIKGLKGGETVFIMPDAFQDEDSTLMIEFCGRLMSVMLGTAILARKTGSWILPAVSGPHGVGLGFKTWFGERILHSLAHDAALSQEQTKIADYSVIRKLFGQFEGRMSNELYLWQSVRAHLAHGSDMRLASPESIPSLCDALAQSPVYKTPDLVVDLR